MTGGRTGRPIEFTGAIRTRYLAALANGANLGEAAAMVGLDRSLPTRYARTDPEFAAAVANARALGRIARVRDLPHDEYRHNVHKCRCTTCTTAARKGRAARRTAATTDPEPGAGRTGPAEVLAIRAGLESSTSFLLAKAS